MKMWERNCRDFKGYHSFSKYVRSKNPVERKRPTSPKATVESSQVKDIEKKDKDLIYESFIVLLKNTLEIKEEIIELRNMLQKSIICTSQVWVRGEEIKNNR